MPDRWYALPNVIRDDGSSASSPAATSRPLPGIARLAVVLEIFLGVGALFGGGVFLLAPDGHLLGMTTKTLAGSSLQSYLVPGILLFLFVGVAPLLAAAITVRRQAIAPFAAVAVGLTLIGWISVEAWSGGAPRAPKRHRADEVARIAADGYP